MNNTEGTNCMPNKPSQKYTIPYTESEAGKVGHIHTTISMIAGEDTAEMVVPIARFARIRQNVLAGQNDRAVSAPANAKAKKPKRIEESMSFSSKCVPLVGTGVVGPRVSAKTVLLCAGHHWPNNIFRESRLGWDILQLGGVIVQSGNFGFQLLDFTTDGGPTQFPEYLLYAFVILLKAAVALKSLVVGFYSSVVCWEYIRPRFCAHVVILKRWRNRRGRWC